nr:uncharacterized protein LOC105482148 [Macaca nemestrina]
MSPCTTTSNRVCQCKPGSFRNGNSTEMCRKCSTGCPRGMIKVSDCTPWSDINCTTSAASSTEKTPAAEDTVTTSLGTPASPGFVLTVFEWIFIVAGVLVIIVLLAFCISCWKKLISYLKGICSGRCWLRVGALDTVCPAPSHSLPTDSNPHPCPWSKCLQPGSIFRLVIAPSPHPVYPSGPWSHRFSRGWGSPHLPAKCRRAGPVPPTFRPSQAGGGRLLNWVTRVRMRSGCGIYSALVRAEHGDFPCVGFYSSSPSHPPSSGCPRIARPYSCSQPQGSLSSVPAPSLPLCPAVLWEGGAVWAPPCLLRRLLLFQVVEGTPNVCTETFSGVHVLHEFMSLHGTEDNAHKETLRTRFLHPTQVSEQEIKGQEPAEPTDVTVQLPEEPQHLLVS